MTNVPVAADTSGTLTNIKTIASTGAPTEFYQGVVVLNAADQDPFGILTETAPATDTGSAALNGRMQRVAQRLTSLIALLPAALGITTKAASLSVAIASDQVVDVKEKKAATGTLSNVSASATSVTLLASNANRLGVSVFNDSTALLYLMTKTGGTASATSHTVQVLAGGYYEAPYGFTGDVIGIWVSATGTARVTEYT